MFVKMLGWIVRIQTDSRQLVPVIGREHGTVPPQFEKSFLKQRSNETLPASVDSRDANEASAIARHFQSYCVDFFGELIDRFRDHGGTSGNCQCFRLFYARVHAFEQMIADAQSIGHYRERRVHRAAGTEEACVNNVEIVEFVRFAIAIQRTGLRSFPKRTVPF